MSYIQRRFISTVRYFNNVYASSSDLRGYIRYALTRYCASSGLDAQGAEVADISGGAHSGGNHPTEPFHLTFTVMRADGVYISTTNPYTGLPTIRHHYRIAQDRNDLLSRAAQWAAAGRPPP